MFRSPSTPSFSSPSAANSTSLNPLLSHTASLASMASTSSSAALADDEDNKSSSANDLDQLCSTGISHNMGKLNCDVTNIHEDTAASSPVTPATASCLTPLSSNAARHVLRANGGCGSATSSSGRRNRLARMAASAGGPTRPNPFDSMVSSDSLKFPILSPSVFATVESPSQQSNESSGRFWSVEQQASLFPAHISDESPWKQECATSYMQDPEADNRTQEAINLYFSRNHQIESPDLNNSGSMMAIDAAHSTAAVVGDTSMMQGGGESPVMPNNRPSNGSRLAPPSRRESSANVTRQASMSTTTSSSSASTATQWSQTALTLPPVLPAHLEEALKAYFTFDERQDDQLPPAQQLMDTGGSSTPLEDQQAGNLSTSTLRRKLFEGMTQDSSSEDEAGGFPDYDEDEDKENDQRPRHCANIMSSPIEGAPLPPSSAEKGSAPPPPSRGSRFSSPPQPLMITPLSKMNRVLRNPKWSSSPISAKVSRRTSMTPPGSMESPTFSPVFGSAARDNDKTPTTSKMK